jgi:hypothetical protein
MHPYHAELERRRRREQREQLRRQRMVAQARPQPRARHLSRALGRHMIRLGSHLAAEPAREGARLP